MRVDCSLFIALRQKNSDSRCGRKKCGFMGLGKKKINGSTSYYLFLQCGTKKAEKYDLNKTILHRLHRSHINKGMATILFNNPEITIFIADAEPKKLDILLNCLEKYCSTKEMNEKYLITNKEEDVSSAELVMLLQKRMIIKSRADYPRTTTFPPNLVELRMSSIGLKSIDFRWFHLRNLKLLNLSNNNLGKYMKELDWRKFSHIQRLTVLEDLNLSENDFQNLPNEFYESLPVSINCLDLSKNNLEILSEKIGRLKKLNQLFLDFNNLCQLPEDLAILNNLQSLTVSNNCLVSLPGATFTRKSHNRFSRLDLSGNDKFYNPERVRRLYSIVNVPFLYQIASAVLMNNFLQIQFENWDNVLPKIVHSEIRSYLQRCAICLKLFPQTDCETTPSTIKRIKLSDFSSFYSGPEYISIQQFFCLKCAP